MSSSSNSDEENALEKFNVESQKSKDEAELVTKVESLKVKERNEETQSPTNDEGIFRLKYRFAEEDVESLEKAEKVDLSSVLSSKPRIYDKRQYTAEGISGTAASNWRNPSTHYSKNKEKYTAVSLSNSWRDPNYKYERCDTFKKRRNEDATVNRYSSFGNVLVDLPKPRDRSKQGNWTLTCAPDIILENGLTEEEHIINCVNELHAQNGELFATPRPSEFRTAKGEVKINCYTSNYEDKVNVSEVADVLMKKIKHYPYCMFYFYKKLPLYMRTCENEFYELVGVNWKLIEFDD